MARPKNTAQYRAKDLEVLAKIRAAYQGSNRTAAIRSFLGELEGDATADSKIRRIQRLWNEVQAKEEQAALSVDRLAETLAVFPSMTAAADYLALSSQELNFVSAIAESAALALQTRGIDPGSEEGHRQLQALILAELQRKPKK